MAFRGFGDDAMKVKQEKRQAQIQREQIAASERASQRAASGQAAALGENARQANMADERAGAQLEAGNARFDKQLAAETAQSDKRLALAEMTHADDMALRREGLEADKAARADSLAIQTKELSQRERQIQLNEKTAARLDEQYALEQAAQEELRREDTATELAVIRAASTSTGPLSMPYINALNNVRGKAYGDPGSVTQVFPVIDPQTGARLGIGTVKIGDDGKPIQSILDPAQTVPRVLASMTPEKQAEYIQTLTGANKARGSDRVTAAALKYAQENRLQFGKTDPASLVKELGEQEDILRTTKAPKAGAGGAADPANQENLDRIKTIKTNVLKTMEQMTSEEGAASAQPKLSPEQQAFVTPAGSETQGAASTAGTGATINKEAGTVTVRIGDQIRTVPDTPALRDWLKKNKITAQ